MGTKDTRSERGTASIWYDETAFEKERKRSCLSDSGSRGTAGKVGQGEGEEEEGGLKPPEPITRIVLHSYY